MPFAAQPTSKGHSVVISAIFVVIAFVAGIAIGFDKAAAVARTSSNPAFHSLVASSTQEGAVIGIGSLPPVGLAQDVDFTLFWTVWSDLKSQFYQQPVSEKKMFYGALRGLTESLNDPYTNFFEPHDAEEFNNALKGEFSGIGAEVGVKNDALQVISPLPDSPAEKAGIKARDLIMKINGEDSLTMPVDEAVSKIRGPKGTQVKLQLAREKTKKDPKDKTEYETIEVTITRDTIVVKSVRVKPQENGFFLIEIHNFNADVEASFRKAVDEVLDKGAKGIVVDVRNDPGGYLDQAIGVAGEWLKDEVVVEQRERGVITEKYKGTGRGLLKGMPTVVLVNEGSASASEILAGAIQDTKIGVLVGKKTFGKGSVQDYKEYPDGSAVKITIAEWLTPNGRSINKEGIQPDVEVELTPEDANADRDPQLEKALELLRTGQTKPAEAR